MLRYSTKLLLTAFLAPALALSGSMVQAGGPLDGPIAASSGPYAATRQSETLPFIIGFVESPVATYQGEIPNLQAPPRRGQGRGKVDMQSSQAKGYARALEVRQKGREKDMGLALGRPIAATARMQHAFNGIIAELTAEEAAQVKAMVDVILVEAYTEYLLDTDVGPLLIEADQVWFDNPVPPGLVKKSGSPANPLPKGTQGEGIVFGIVDSGVNWASPSFAEVDMDGFVHANPLGEGVFLGTCAPGGIDEGRCNAKLIGGYDFVCTLTTVCVTPGLLEIPGFSDENGHGSHVASTAAGNRRMATFRGNELEISGVAPRGNVIAYDVCYTNAAGQGLCPNVSTLAAINQAIADGVDVINFSISGGALPWNEANSLAFLAASDAGVFVSASAGNSGPGAGTLGHVEPWVATVAAAQHGRGGFDFFLDITSPVPPADLGPIFLTPGVNGVAFEEEIAGTTPLVVSPGIDTGDDGCAAFAAGTFEGAIAVIRRGACAFSDKTNNAEAAGAVATIIANNLPGVLSPSVPGTSIPAFLISQADGDALRDFVADQGPVTAGIPLEAFVRSNTPDALAAFSSRGPSGFDLLKPDVTAPGVAILAADAGGPSLDGLEELVGLKNGTSMASPHNAGAGGLLRQIHPDWSPAEVKSALVMTAEQTVLLEDQTSPAGPFAAGGGRINVERAARSGLVLHETTQNYLAANPADDGDPSSLNLPSMASQNCIGSCSFSRTFRAARANQNNWNATLVGLSGSVDQPRFNLGGSGLGTLTVEIDTSGFASDGAWHFGALVLTPRGKNSGSPELRLPIAVRVPPPELVLSADQVGITLGPDSTGEVQVEISNNGGPFLEYQVDNAGVAVRTLADQPRGAVNTGTRSGFITDLGVGLYASDDFTIGSETTLSFLSAEGFTQGQPIGTGATTITWSVFPDAGGQPAGNPETSPGAAVWSFTSAPNGPGVGTAGNIITLDLEAAGQNVVLPPGTWWVVVHSTTTSVANNWIWFFSNSGSGNPPHTVFPASTGPGWAPNLNFAGLAYLAEGTVECGASWIGAVTPDSGSLDFGESDVLSIQIDTTGLEPGAFTGFVCIDSNDPNQPQATIEIQLNVEP